MDNRKHTSIDNLLASNYFLSFLIRMVNVERNNLCENFCLLCFVWVEALGPSKKIFSHVGMEPPLPGYNQYFLGGKCILLKDTTWRPE